MTAKYFVKTGSVINLQEKEILVKNVKMPKYPHVRKTFTIDQKSKPDS